MTTLSPLFLEQEIWLKMTGFGHYDYTRNPEYGVTFINIEIEIEADTLDRWSIAEIRVEKGNSTPAKQEFEVMPHRLYSHLSHWLIVNFGDELQCHVAANLLPASLADHADRIYDERNS